MAQTFRRVNKTRNIDDTADLRKSIKSKQERNLDKHRNGVYSMISPDDEFDEDDLDLDTAFQE